MQSLTKRQSINNEANMKTFLAVLIIMAFYVVTLAGLYNLFGPLVGGLYLLFGAPFSTIFITDALQNYSFFNEA